jgi:hypothetical protein
MFGNRVFNDSPVLHVRLNDIIAQSILTFTITRASAQHGVYQGKRTQGGDRQARLSCYHDRLASVNKRLPVENVCVIARAIGEAVF